MKTYLTKILMYFFEYFLIIQNPNDDTEWNDVLRAKGIIPPKPVEKEITEDEIVKMLEGTIQERSGGISYLVHCTLHLS